MATAENSYTAEVASAKQRIKILKNRLARRAAARQGVASGKQAGTPTGQVLGEGDEAATAAAEATATLKGLIAAHLLQLEPHQLPSDSQNIQKKLGKSEKAAELESALEKSGHTSLLPVFEEMAAAKCFELDKDSDEKESRLWVDNLDPAQLLRLTGQDAGARLLPPGPQPEALPKPPMQSEFTSSQPQRSSMAMGQMPMGGPPSGAPPPLFPGPPMQPPASLGSGSQGGPMRPMPPGQHNMQMGMSGPAPGPFGGVPSFRPPGMPMGPPTGPARPPGPDLDALLSKQTVQGRARTERGEELLDLIQKPTAKETATVEKFRTAGGPAMREYCPHLTKEDCCVANQRPFACGKLHFRRLIFAWTDPSLGNCSYLDTCRHMKGCKYIHYELDDATPTAGDETVAKPSKPSVPDYLQALGQPQWITCDIRTFDMNVLGKFGVIMADPPWEIHQDLPYGTMADDEMRKMNIKVLQDDGVIFLWVTGRAMELGRECLALWGYKRVDELIWVKTNQLQRLIRTGRTGHWLNHSKEHCLVGVKGRPQINRNLDCDVLVAEVRETSRKPDEMYSLLERLSPGTRKLEIFARPHNVQPGWVCLGNQLDGTKIADPEMLAAYTKAYGNPTTPKRQLPH
ncbi:hypothetical protein WJX82_003213 [Trebouxia sp. C0006]